MHVDFQRVPDSFFPIPVSCEWRLQRACSKKESLSRDCFNTVLRHVKLSANVKVMLSTKSRHDVHLFIASNTIGCGFTELGTFYSSCSRFYSGRPMFRSRWARLLATYFERHLRQPIFTPILVILSFVMDVLDTSVKVILCASEHICSIVRYCFRSFKQL